MHLELEGSKKRTVTRTQIESLDPSELDSEYIFSYWLISEITSGRMAYTI